MPSLKSCIQPVWEGLAEHKWSDAQLVELDRELARLDFLTDYKLAMHSELVLAKCGGFDHLRRHPEQLYSVFRMNLEKAVLRHLYLRESSAI